MSYTGRRDLESGAQCSTSPNFVCPSQFPLRLPTGKVLIYENQIEITIPVLAQKKEVKKEQKYMLSNTFLQITGVT